jgi:hypothetical protein
MRPAGSPCWEPCFSSPLIESRIPDADGGVVTVGSGGRVRRVWFFAVWGGGGGCCLEVCVTRCELEADVKAGRESTEAVITLIDE